MKKYLYITADAHAGDYISALSEIKESELLELEPIFQLIKNSPQRHNWPSSNTLGHSDQSLGELYPGLTDDQMNLVQQYIPQGHYGIHTIVDIKVLDVVEEKVILTKF